MVKSSVLSAASETVCPACGASIKTPPAARRRRVQCPKCREVVFIGTLLTKEPEPVAPAAEPPAATADAHDRIQSLEARVEALEATLRDAMAARVAVGSDASPRKLLWVTTAPGQSPEFSPEQGQALFHNLGGVRSQAITIRMPTGDPAAQAHAEWFKAIFERAGWIVRGPEEIEPATATAGLSLAVPELPVAKEAAATYLALKAAGFEANAILDSASGGESPHGYPALSLILPPGKAA